MIKSRSKSKVYFIVSVLGVDIPEPLICILIYQNIGMILVQHVLKVVEKVGFQTLIIIHLALELVTGVKNIQLAVDRFTSVFCLQKS